MSETFNYSQPYSDTQHCKWYRPTGRLQELILKAFDGNANIPDTELEELRVALGRDFHVRRTNTMHGYGKARPKLFRSPHANEENVYYLMCPVGLAMDSEAVTSMTAEGQELDEAETLKLTKALFTHGGVPALLDWRFIGLAGRAPATPAPA